MLASRPATSQPPAAGGRWPPAFDAASKVPGGGFAASADDLARYAVALMTDRLLRPETRAAMGTSQSTADGMPTGYGLGWELQRWGGKPTASHGGGPPGVTTLLLVAPARACAVVALTNRGGAPGLAELVRRVAGAACP